MKREDAAALLPEEDVDFLFEKGLSFTAYRHGDTVMVIIHSYDLPAAYEPRVVDLLIELPASYPNGNPDMFWTKPWVKLSESMANPRRSSTRRQLPDGLWQRWSRHFESGWRPGVDGLRQYLASVASELRKGI